jgi:hypothetical protein
MSMGKWFVLADAFVAIGVPAALAASPDKDEPVTAAQSLSAEKAVKACIVARESMGRGVREEVRHEPQPAKRIRQVRLVKGNSQGEAAQFVERSHRELVRRSNVDHNTG